MAVYESPRGVLYNLDNFVSFNVDTSNVSGPGGNPSSSRLEAETATGHRVVIHSGSEEKCKEAWMDIRKLLRLPREVALSNDTLTFLRRISKK